jgi:hypothetical protein
LGYPDTLCQEECLPSLRLRLRTWHKCTYYLPLILEDRHTMTKGWRGSFWLGPGLEASTKRPGIRRYTGSLSTLCREEVCPSLTEAPSTGKVKQSFPESGTHPQYTVRDMSVQGWLKMWKPCSAGRKRAGLRDDAPERGRLPGAERV